MTMERKQYEMTQDDLDKLLEACRPVPMIMLQCGTPPTPQERANAAWAELGKRMGFDYMTVKPAGSDPKQFSAVPSSETDPPSEEERPEGAQE